jgi:hypothetical protein
MGLTAMGGSFDSRPLAIHEGVYNWVVAPRTQCLWRTMGNGRVRYGIEKNAIVTDMQKALQIVADQHDGDAETVAQIQDQIIQPFG